MSEYDFNSTECLERIKQIIMELPSGMTPEMLKSILHINFSQELMNDMVSDLRNRMNESVEYMWREREMPSKMMHLKQLAESSSAENVAWRPKTGQADSSAIMAKALLDRKARLEKHLAKVKAESDDVNKYIKEFHEKLQQQLNLANLHSVKDVNTKDL